MTTAVERALALGGNTRSLGQLGWFGLPVRRPISRALLDNHTTQSLPVCHDNASTMPGPEIIPRIGPTSSKYGIWNAKLRQQYTLSGSTRRCDDDRLMPVVRYSVFWRHSKAIEENAQRIKSRLLPRSKRFDRHPKPIYSYTICATRRGRHTICLESCTPTFLMCHLCVSRGCCDNLQVPSPAP